MGKKIEQKERTVFDTAEDLFGIVNKVLYSHRIVKIDDDIMDWNTNNTINTLLSLALQNPKIPIYLHINSNGGDAYEMLRIYDCVHGLPCKVITFVEGKAFSAGAWIAACCGTGGRKCARNALYMFHEVSSFSYGKLKDMDADHQETKRVWQRMVALLKKHTRLTKEDIEAIESSDQYMTATKAKKKGIVDEVV